MGRDSHEEQERGVWHDAIVGFAVRLWSRNQCQEHPNFTLCNAPHIFTTAHKTATPSPHLTTFTLHIPTQDDPSHLTNVIIHEIHTFLAELAPLEIKSRELVKLLNSHPTPFLTYRVMAHCLPQSTILKTDSFIWTRLVFITKDSGLASIPPT